MDRRKKFLLFDIDGTLLHSGGAGRRALGAALCEAGVAAEVVEAISLAGKTDRRIVLAALRDSGHHPAALPGLMADVLESYLVHLAANLEERPARPYALVRELLAAVRERADMEPGLLTGNIPAGARLKLESARLGDHFSWGVYGDHSEERSDLAREALRRLQAGNGGVHPRDVFVIGDTCADIACGRAIGAVTIAVTSGFEPAAELAAAAPDHLVPGFRQLFDLWDLPLPRLNS
ncbi:MAG: HAD hydrolase-like protein [Candidatus Aminicenantes bacterium]|nr:HAD hydrolase-like protein [Candidatus Aminicenantes bacterium]